ncbi:MAG: hypothetical protein LBE36_07530 [Flavobacteriaceae bacterium]|nr:hypothetical protein [Flavobacteriaceae bacterium]
MKCAVCQTINKPNTQTKNSVRCVLYL